MEILYFPVFMIALFIVLAAPAYIDILIDCWIACKKRRVEIKKDADNFDKYGV